MAVTHRPLLRILLVLAVLVAACGGGGSTPDTAPTETPVARPTPARTDPVAAVTEFPTPGTAEAGTLRYVALGDSLASGMHGGPSYVDAYAGLLEQRVGRDVELTNLGYPGWTSGDLLAALRSDERFREAVSTADVVTWNIGGNDLIEASIRLATQTCGDGDHDDCLDRAYDRFVQQWDAIVAELVALRAAPDVPLQTIDLYRPFATIRDVRTDATLATLDRFNAHITATEQRADVTVTTVADTFDQHEGLISGDGLHPSPAGHRAIAVALLRSGGT